MWKALRDASRLPGFEALPDLLDVDPDGGTQALHLAAAVRARGITHLHAHFASVATTVARAAARLSGVTYSFTAHAKDIFHDDVDDDDLRRKLVDAHHAITVSDYNLTDLRRRFGADATRRLHRVHNGLDLATFAWTPTPSSPGDRVVAVGRLVEKKGFDVLIDACATVVASGRPLQCDIVGGGPLEDQLRHQIRARGLGEIVRLHGPMPQDDVRRIVASGDVFVAPCVVGTDGNRDGLPTVLLEAMALGTPCVATPVTGIPEAIVDGRTGLLVRERDVAATARAIRRVLDEPDLARSLSAAARSLVEDCFDIARQAACLDQLLPGATAGSQVDRTRGARLEAVS